MENLETNATEENGETTKTIYRWEKNKTKKQTNQDIKVWHRVSEYGINEYSDLEDFKYDLPEEVYEKAVELSLLLNIHFLGEEVKDTSAFELEEWHIVVADLVKNLPEDIQGTSAKKLLYGLLADYSDNCSLPIPDMIERLQTLAVQALQTEQQDEAQEQNKEENPTLQSWT